MLPNNRLEKSEMYNLYWGDLHSHCSISYGHGTVEQALMRAKIACFSFAVKWVIWFTPVWRECRVAMNYFYSEFRRVTRTFLVTL